MKKDAPKTRLNLCCFLLLSLALMACQKGTDANSTANAEGAGDAANAELCRKYEACGCQKFAQCMEQAANSPELQKPGVRECMLKSSCQSLCAGHPDACINGTGGQQGAGTSPGQPQRSDCSHIRCSQNTDCPSDCYGGCDGVICYSF